MPEILHPDGTFDFSRGVNAARMPTVQSAANPHGLPRNALAWITNGTTRGGGIQSRYGWNNLVPGAMSGLYQGGYLYEPIGENPHLVLLISGHLFKVLVEPPYTVTDLSAGYGLVHPADQPQAFFDQAEEFLIVQSGDANDLPLFYWGTGMRRSLGLSGSPKEIPAATCMAYYAGRLWYARDRIYTAGDIVRGDAGTSAFGDRDSVLKVTENPLAFGGDGFSVPSEAGAIRALMYPASIDTNLGQGPLLIGTRKAVYSLTVPVSRTAWTAASDNQPLQVVAQVKWGPVNDRGVVHVNGDLFYQTLEPGIRSLAFARRNYGQWPNVPISNNVRRITRRNDRALLRYVSGINWDNRLWQTGLPEVTSSGVVHPVVTVLDFDPLSSMEEQLPPVWDGHSEGLRILQMFEGDFGGLQRAFAVVLSNTDTIDVWELSRADQFENGDNRITWSFETPSWTWADTIGERQLKRLVGCELEFDQITGTSIVTVEFRPDSYPCWILWHEFTVCSARDSAEDPNTADYPAEQYLPGHQSPIALPKPPAPCIPGVNRPGNIARRFQLRITVKGWLRITALTILAEKFGKAPYHGQIC